MGRILWYADRPIKTPQALRWGVETVLWWFLEGDDVLIDEWDIADAAHVRAFVDRKRGPHEPEVFSTVRNLMDSETINGGCECSGDACEFCLWCQAIVLRDWLDALMVEAGCHQPPYVEAYVTPHTPPSRRVAAAWRRSDCGTHRREPAVAR